jgi:hypothetical protein
MTTKMLSSQLSDTARSVWVSLLSVIGGSTDNKNVVFSSFQTVIAGSDSNKKLGLLDYPFSPVLTTTKKAWSSLLFLFNPGNPSHPSG